MQFGQNLEIRGEWEKMIKHHCTSNDLELDFLIIRITKSNQGGGGEGGYYKIIVSKERITLRPIA